MIMTLKQFKTYCLKKNQAEETFPFDFKTLVMKVKGKMFAITSIDEFKMKGEIRSAFHHISLKCDPDMGDELRRSFPAIVPAWHLNKLHWMSIIMDGSLKDSFIKELIDHSYDLVVSKLPKKIQFELYKEVC